MARMVKERSGGRPLSELMKREGERRRFLNWGELGGLRWETLTTFIYSMVLNNDGAGAFFNVNTRRCLWNSP